MLRISVEPANGLVTIRLEGRVVGPWVDECDRAWRSVQADLGRKKVRLDLREVQFMDDRGTGLLREIRKASHAEVVADSPLTEYFAERIMREIEIKDNKGV
jgi:anti-anti-sigma regulatory factor